MEFGLLEGLMNKGRCFNGASIYLSIFFSKNIRSGIISDLLGVNLKLNYCC
jgi:hypothetical protein